MTFLEDNVLEWNSIFRDFGFNAKHFTSFYILNMASIILQL